MKKLSRNYRGCLIFLSIIILSPIGSLKSQEDFLFWPARIDIPTIDRAPGVMATGDFDEDGHLDIVVMSEQVDSLALYLGTGKGTFLFASRHLAGYQQEYGVADDLNGDDHLDIAVVNYLSDNLSVLLGRGNGTFEPTVLYNAGNGPTDLALSDLNHDTFPDLIVSSYWSKTLAVFLNDGSGMYLPEPFIQLDQGLIDIAAGDLTGDGHPDVAVLKYYDQQIEIFQGDGIGNLNRFGYVDAGHSLLAMIVEDVNRDSILDIIAVDQTILLGQGDGTFVLVEQPDIQGNGDHIFPLDFNGDEILDLGLTTSSNIRIVLGSGNGTFVEDTTYFTGNAPSHIGFGDVNDDGLPDLFSVNRSGNAIAILLADGLGSYYTSPSVPLSERPMWMVSADFVEDGNIDLAITTNSSEVIIWQGHGDGTFDLANTIPIGYSPDFFTTCDLDSDSHTDLITVHEYRDSLAVLLGDGQGFFSPQPFGLVLGNPIWVAVGYFNSDNHQDVAVAESDPKGVTVIFGDGSGRFERGPFYPMERRPEMIEKGDFNEDGYDDLVIDRNTRYSDPAILEILQGNGDGSFSHSHSYTFTRSITSIVVGDYNQDSHLDVALSNDSEINILYGLGNGSFDRSTAYGLTSNPMLLQDGDFNGDGVTDLAVTLDGNRNVGILFADPISGMVPSSLAYGCNGRSDFMAGGDFNNDGSLDIAVAGVGSGWLNIINQFSILLNTGGVTGIDPTIEDGQTLPRSFILGQNYPNPFNPSTTIRYEILSGRGSVPVKIMIHDVRGRLVKRLVDEEKEPGSYQVHWNGRDDGGEAVSSGVYLYKIRSGDFTSVRKMVLVR